MSSARWAEVLRRTRSPSFAVLAVALVGLANLIVLLAQAPALVHSFYLNADHASALVLPALAGRAPAGAVVNMGAHPWYEPWWFMRATSGVPGSRQLWEAAPFVFGLLGSAAVAACAWSALGRFAALLCAVVLVASSEALRGILYVPESHGAAVIHLAALCGALLFVQRRAEEGRSSPRTLLVVGVPLVLFTAVGFTDQLVVVSGLGPLVLAPLWFWWRVRTPAWRATAVFALVTGVLALLLALLLTHVMVEQHVVHSRFAIDFVATEAIATGLENLLAAVAQLGGGGFFGMPASGSNLLTFAAGLLTLLALGAILRTLWRRAAGALAQVSTGRPVADASPRAGSRELYIVYWGAVLAVVIAVYTATSLSSHADGGRYLLGAWVAGAALLTILASTPLARTVLVAGVVLFGCLNLYDELSSGVPSAGVGPGQRLAGEIAHFARANGASVGYGGYWDSAPVMWETHLGVKLYPIQPCLAPSGACAFINVQISSWYTPRRNTRSFLLTDTRKNIPWAVYGPPPGFGPAIGAVVLGEGLELYLYDHDIAANLGKPEELP